jgi:hypothetical protein
MCAHVDNQQSHGVVIARLQLSVWSLLHQRRDLHQSTYLYLAKDREPTSHQLRSCFFPSRGKAGLYKLSHSSPQPWEL